MTVECKSLNVVPWFSTEEWDHVCKLIYSDNVQEQTKGYQQLLVWKARVPTLPASVTCTLELLQVRLQDQDMWPKIVRGEAPLYAEQELRLVYSTVVMRFLNHLASLFQNTQNQTLYSVAKKLHIPVWVVNIRHDAAHDRTLPSIDVLRLAAGYALSWLLEYWWKPEALRLSDWKYTEDGVEDTHSGELSNLLDLWQALKLYQETDYSTVDHIPDCEVRAQVSILHSKINSSFDNEAMPDSDIEVTADYNCARGMSIKAASSLVLFHIRRFISEINHFNEWDQIFVNNLVGEGIFTPSLLSDEDWLHVDDNILPRRALKMWEPVLACLPMPVLLCLMQKLLLLTHNINGVVSKQSKLAALWVRELAVAVCKLCRVLDLVEKISAMANSGTEPVKMVKLANGISVNLAENDKLAKLTSKLLCKKLVVRVEAECPELKDVLVLNIKALPSKKEAYEVVKFAVLNPNKMTPIFLPSLMKMVNTPALVDTQSKLLSLVELFTQCVVVDIDVDMDAPVFTVSDLSSSVAHEGHTMEARSDLNENSSVEEMDAEEGNLSLEQKSSYRQQNVPKSQWQHAEENPNWSKCPVGKLLWQQDQIWDALIISDANWQLSEDVEDVYNFNNLPQLFGKAIEWEDVKRRRQKKKGSAKLGRKIVETALETVSRIIVET